MAFDFKKEYKEYYADPAIKRYVYLSHDGRCAPGHGHGGRIDQEPHQGQRPVCLELLLSVPVVRYFHRTCSVLKINPQLNPPSVRMGDCFV